MKKYLLLLILFNINFSYAQFNEVQVVDSNSDSGGIRQIYTANINNDGLKDILVTRAYNFDRISVYQNSGNNNFTEIVIDNIQDPVFITSADLNENGFQDIITITESEGDLIWYPNANGNFGNAITIDHENTFGKSIVTGDFNNDSHLDLVVIWQHSINFYENDGNGNFTKNEILTTATSPNILECWTLTKADVNNDGNLDVITGETIGGVIYKNDGNANFTPQTFTNATHSTITSLAIFDANNDSFLDAVIHRATGDVSLYLNEGNNLMNFNFHSDLMQVNSSSIELFETADVNNDGNMDIYTAFNAKPRVFLNDGNLDFSNEIILDDNPNIFVDEVFVTDLNNDNQQEFIWSGANNTIAYQTYGSLAVVKFKTSKPRIFPNPAGDFIQLQQEKNQLFNASIFSLQGKKLVPEFKLKPNTKIDVSFLSPGIYLLKTTTENGKSNFQKFSKK